VEVFFAETVDIRIAVLPEKLDPDELLQKPDGRERFAAAVAAAEDALAYKVRRFRTALDPAAGVSARQKALERLLSDLSEMGFASMQGVRKRLVLTQLADVLNLTVADVEQAMPKRRAPRASVPAAAELEQDAAGSSPLVAVSRARRRAEHELLALVVYEPTLAGMSFTLEGNRSGRLAELFRDQFLDAGAARIARAAFPLAERQGTFTVQQLLGELDDEDARRTATALYFEGERLCTGEPGMTPERMAAAAAATLDADIRQEQYHRAVAEFRQNRSTAGDLDAFTRILEKRRQQDTIAAAIHHGVRT
jgi:DNA primase